MKQIFTLLTFLLATVSFSQSKTAHINYNALVLAMPETQEASKQLDQLTKNYQDQLVKLEAEFKTKAEVFQKEEKTLQPAMRELKLKEIKDLETSYNNFKEAARKEISAKDKALFDPIFAKAKKAVTDVAKDKGYSYVIDSSKGEYVYMDPKDDIMELAKKKLNL